MLGSPHISDIPHTLWNDRWARAAIAQELEVPSEFKAWRLGWWATLLPPEQMRIVMDWAIDAFEALIPTRTGPGNDAGPFCDMAAYLTEPQRARAVDIARRMRAAGWREEIDYALEALAHPPARARRRGVDAKREKAIGPLAGRIELAIEGFLATPDWLGAIVREKHFLPLYNGWTAILGVRPDGRFVRWNHEADPQTFDNHVEPYWQRLAACHGARRYREIAELIPARPKHATTCAHCHGIGVIAALPHIGCYCAGAGWLLPGEPPAQGIG
jgi:hypothetical protein